MRLGDTLKTFLVGLLFALALRTFAFEPFSIPTPSMLPTLLVGDYLFVAKWPYGFSRYSLPGGALPFHGRILAAPPVRGDIAVFIAPSDNRTDYIKRVIGLPGDRVQMRGGVLWLNGKAVPKLRIADFISPAGLRTPQYAETLPGGAAYHVLDAMLSSPGDSTPVFTVPSGHYFLMGDNRDDSADSRFPVSAGGIGFVPAENLVGRAAVMFFSSDGSARPWRPGTWIAAIRADRIGGTFR